MFYTHNLKGLHRLLLKLKVNFLNFRSIYLENKHLSSEHSNRVKVAFTDIGPVVIRSFGGPGAVGMTRRRLRWPWLWATGRHGGQGLSGPAVWLTFGKKQRNRAGWRYFTTYCVSYFGCVVSFIQLHVLMIWISTVDAVSQIITLSQRS